MANDKKWLFGTTNIRWGIKQLILMYSNQPSFFSKKRIESGIAYTTAIGMDISFVIKRWSTLDTYDFLSHIVILLFVAGYAVNQIQREKRDGTSITPTISGSTNDETESISTVTQTTVAAVQNTVQTTTTSSPDDGDIGNQKATL